MVIDLWLEHGNFWFSHIFCCNLTTIISTEVKLWFLSSLEDFWTDSQDNLSKFALFFEKKHKFFKNKAPRCCTLWNIYLNWNAAHALCRKKWSKTLYMWLRPGLSLRLSYCVLIDEVANTASSIWKRMMILCQEIHHKTRWYFNQIKYRVIFRPRPDEYKMADSVKAYVILK